MALITEFVPSASEARRLHPTTVTCGWLAFGTEVGPVLQLDTYGSADRQVHGKVTQTVQLDRDAAEHLLRLIESTFPGIR